MKIKNTGFTLVEVMVVVGIIALVASIAIPNLLRSRMQANDTAAKASLKSLSTASETYYASNAGSYPGDVTSLIGPNPPYFSDSTICSSVPKAGYSYNCNFFGGGYTFTATPLNIGSSGTTTYTMNTGGVITP